MSTGLMDKLLDVVEAAEFERAGEEFVSAGLAMLALAISRLSPEEREEALQAIEDGSALGRMGIANPSEQQIEMAVAANSRFMSELEMIAAVHVAMEATEEYQELRS